MSSGLEKKRFQELALRAVHTGAPQFTRFLEPPQESQAHAAANEAGCRVEFFGGYDGAERRVAAFLDGAADRWPIERLRLSWNPKYGAPGHRDLLGALMALGVAREALGDIAVFADHAALFVHTDVAGYVIASVESAGRVKLRAARDEGDFSPPAPEGALSYHTVSSERLDALVAAAFRLSREDAQKLVLSEMVKRNHAVEARPDARLCEGDVVSARGYGRFTLSEITGTTKKGRIGVRLFVFGK